MNINKETKTHIMHIFNPERVTGVLICNKCRDYGVYTNETHPKRDIENHVEKCTGKFEKKLKLDKIQKPYVPHLTKNPILIYLMENNRLNEWKPKEYYITFNCETVRELIEEKTSKTTISAKLYLLSAALSAKLLSNLKDEDVVMR